MRLSKKRKKEPAVKVRATFVVAKSGSKPLLYVEDPIDLSELFGDIYANEFDVLKKGIDSIVKESNYNLFFHNDDSHEYTFDNSQFQHGAVFGRKSPRLEDEGNKVTASKLCSIRDADQFKAHILNVSDIIYHPSRKSSRKRRKVNFYCADLCVVLCKRNVKRVSFGKKKATTSAAAAAAPTTTTPELVPVPITNIMTNIPDRYDDACTVVSTITNSANSTSSKRKKPSIFKFPARKLSISLFAPIEQQQRKQTTVTCVPTGKTIKDIEYDLDTFIFSPEDILDEDEVEDVVDDNERFISLFTLSRFRKDMIMLALEQFPEEYSLKTKILGSKCKLFCRKQFNSCSWSEIMDTNIFHKYLKDQMQTKSRVKDGMLDVRLSFGRSKSGMEFIDLGELEDYVKEDAIHFEKNEEPTSPFVRKIGAIKRDDHWKNPARVMELINDLFRDEGCKLHYGFLQEHGLSFCRIVNADISVNKDASIFLKAMSDPIAHKLSNEQIDKHLLYVYMKSHLNDVDGSILPETNKFPPTNETMMKLPPTLRDWKKSQNQGCDYLNPVMQMHGLRPAQMPFLTKPSNDLSLDTRTAVDDDDIIVIKFIREDNPMDDVSVYIDTPLSKQSTFAEVIEEGDVCEELDIALFNDDKIKAAIKRKDCSDFTIRFGKLKKMKVNTFIKTKNLHDDCVIEFKC